MNPSWHPAFALADLPVGAARVLKAQGKQVAVFRRDETTVYAVDNRCPHEGYPLAQGTIKDTVLTCAWHNFKFDLRDGSCLLGDEAVRWFPTRLRDGQVEIDLSDPDLATARAKLVPSLEAGLLERSTGRVARDVVRLLQAGEKPEALLLEAARFDAEYAEYGTTHAMAVAADALGYLERYRGPEAALPIMLAMDLAGEAHVRRSKRPVATARDPGDDPLAAGEKLHALVEDEDAAGAESLLRGALARGWGREIVEPWPYRLVADHFLDFGHRLIYQVKLFDLLERCGWAEAPALLAAHLAGIVGGTREDLLPAWAGYREHLAERGDEAAGPTHHAELDRDAFIAVVLDHSPKDVHRAVSDGLAGGVPRARLVDALSLAASERLLRFDERIESRREVQENWLDVTHVLTFASAVRHALPRCSARDGLRLLHQAARFINHARPLDLPAGERPCADAGPGPVAVATIAEAIRGKRGPDAIRLLATYLAHGGNVPQLHAAIQDLTLEDPIGRPILLAHLVKTAAAAFVEHAALAADASRALPLLAMTKFLSSPLAEGRLAQTTREAIQLVVHGRKPRTLTA